MEFKNSGGSILFVSHDMNAVKTLCDSAILVDHGHIIRSGKPADVSDHFFGMMLEKAHQGTLEAVVNKPVPRPEPGIGAITPSFDSKQVISTGDVEVVSFRMTDAENGEISHIVSENSVNIEYRIKALKAMDDPHYGIAIKNKLGVSIFETNTYCMKIKTAPLGPGDIATIRFQFFCNLVPGDYSICIGVSNKGYERGLFEEYSLVLHDAGILTVVVNEGQIMYGGVFNMKPAVFINEAPHYSGPQRRP